MSDTKEVSEAKAILKNTPVLKKGDEVSFRQLADGLALLQGDTSEGNVQRILKRLEYDYEMVRATFQERCYKIIGLLLAFGGILGLFSQLYYPSVKLADVSQVVFYLGLVIALIGEIKRDKRVRSLPPCP